MKNALSAINNKLNTISVNASSKKKVCIGAVTGMTVLGTATVPIFANDGGFKEIAGVIADVFQKFYDAAKGVISIIAIILIFICLLMRMISKDERKVASATDWMKRIIITWIIILFLGNIQSLINYIGKNSTNVNLNYTA